MGKVDPSFGRELRRKRRASGRTLDRLAAELGVADKTVGKWERGEVLPSPTNILALEKLGLIGGWQTRNGVGNPEAEFALPQELSDRVRRSFGCSISELLVRIADIRDESECMVIAYFRQLPDRQRWSVLDIVSSMTMPAKPEK